MNSEEADEPQEPREAVEAEEYPEIEYREDESMNFQEALRELHRELHSIALE
jgi:ribosome-binding factor A